MNSISENIYQYLLHFIDEFQSVKNQNVPIFCKKYWVLGKILSQKNGEHLLKKVSVNHFGFSPIYSYSIELKNLKGDRLNVNGKKIMINIPQAPG